MSKNYMSEVAKMLDVEIGEEFDIVDGHGEVRGYGPYKFTEKSIINNCGYDDEEIFTWLLSRLLRGEFAIRKRPWRPKNESDVWVVDPNGDVDWYIFDKNNPGDLALLNMGNCFPTEEVADKAIPEMTRKFEEIKKGICR